MSLLAYWMITQQGPYAQSGPYESETLDNLGGGDYCDSLLYAVKLVAGIVFGLMFIALTCIYLPELLTAFE